MLFKNVLAVSAIVVGTAFAQGSQYCDPGNGICFWSYVSNGGMGPRDDRRSCIAFHARQSLFTAQNASALNFYLLPWLIGFSIDGYVFPPVGNTQYPNEFIGQFTVNLAGKWVSRFRYLVSCLSLRIV